MERQNKFIRQFLKLKGNSNVVRHKKITFNLFFGLQRVETNLENYKLNFSSQEIQSKRFFGLIYLHSYPFTSQSHFYISSIISYNFYKLWSKLRIITLLSYSLYLCKLLVVILHPTNISYLSFISILQRLFSALT